MLKNLNVENFEKEILNNEGIALVDFFATWCGPCKMIAPIIHDIANESTDVTVGKVDIDESLALAEKYGVSSVPTLIVFKNGQEQERLVGFTSKNEILKALEQ
ncbi:MAG: thioredoxin [Lachnospiraceae bacterium]|nr:thioredoxin [Lachnospiraceae bacterium]